MTDKQQFIDPYNGHRRGFSSRVRAFHNLDAWILIGIGLAVFSLRVQFSPGGWINLPILFTVMQTGGLMFAIAGFELIISLAIWPTVNLGQLLKQVIEEENMAAGLVILGLFLFNGLGMVATVMWLTSALGAQIAAG